MTNPKSLSRQSSRRSTISATSRKTSTLGEVYDESKSIHENSNNDNEMNERRNEAVRRLVDDVSRLSLSTITNNPLPNQPFSNDVDPNIEDEKSHEELLLASTVSAAIERGIDRHFHTELLSATHQSASEISKICHEHSDTFLQSVAKVVALVGLPCAKLQTLIEEQNQVLQNETGHQLLHTTRTLKEFQLAEQKARQMKSMVLACHKVAVLLERARKQAALCRPRGALDAVDEARHCLTVPIVNHNSSDINTNKETAAAAAATTTKDNNDDKLNEITTLGDTPFGKRAMEMLPKIENEVLMGTKRGLNRWFLSLRSGGNGSKAGAAALRKCASSMAIGGPGSLGLGGKVQGYEWRAMNADNLIARVGKHSSYSNGRVAKAARMGYWYERDCQNETDRLQGIPLGMIRRAEAFAMAFGWYRCWEEMAPIGVEIFNEDLKKTSSRSILSSKEARSELRRGPSSSLGFSRSSGTTQNKKTQTQWATALTPAILFEDAPSRKDDAEKFAAIPESVHPVRLAESGFGLLGRLDDFRTYYEQNRYGDMKIGSSVDGNSSETRSSLSSLTGDDVSLGTDRVFFAKSLPHLCASVVGFSAVEAALEIGTFEEEEDFMGQNQNRVSTTSSLSNTSNTSSTTLKTSQTTSSFLHRFLESSAKYERSLIAELGKILRSRSVGATLAELARGSCLMAAFRSALKIVHPSSATRKSDRELLAMDVDIIMTALKVAQEEQLKATKKIMLEDIQLVPMRKQPKNRYMITQQMRNTNVDGIPKEESLNFPFGLDGMVRSSVTISVTNDLDDEMDIGMRIHSNHGNDTLFIFSYSVPPILRSIHARAIAFAAFALSQQESGQVFASKQGGGIAGYVLDCVEECICVTMVGMKESLSKNDIPVEQAVQLNLNITAVKAALPRLFGTLMRGLCHVGMIRAEQLEETFQYSDSILHAAEKACDLEIGNTYSILDQACKDKIDTLINFALDNFQWETKIERNTPNAYAEGLIEFMRNTFQQVTALDEGSRAGLHFLCCGEIAERMICLLTEKGETKEEWLRKGGKGIPPITKIDAMGLKNLSLDIAEFKNFAKSTGVPQLEHCFNELESLISILLDKELPALIQPSNASLRQRKYPFLNLELLANLLEKYVGLGLGMKIMKTGGKANEILILEKKEVVSLVRLIRSQL